MPSVFGKSATIALLTLSQVLAVGALSVTPLGRDAVSAGIVAALLAATVGGLLVISIARTRAEISAPASSVAVIYALLGGDLVARSESHATMGELWAALSLAVFVTGILLAIAGSLRLAEAVKFMPAPVNAGFVTGIGLLVMWSQLGPALGLEAAISKYHWSQLADETKPASLLVTTGTIAAMWAYPRLIRRGQPALAGLAAGTFLYYGAAWLFGPEHVGPTLEAIAPSAAAQANARAVWNEVELSWIASTLVVVLPYAAFMALQAIMNAAVTAAAVNGIAGERSNVNRTLKAQGLANLLCGAAGALPVTTAATLSLPAARMKPRSVLVPALGAVLLLAAMLAAGSVLSVIPIAVLSGILIVSGANMIDRWAWSLAARVWRGRANHGHVIGNLVIVAAVTATFFLGSVPLALAVGSILAMLLLAFNLSRATTFERADSAQLASTRVWPAEQAQWLSEVRGSVVVFRPRGGLFFGTADELATRLDAIEPGSRFCVIDMSRLTTLDATGCQIVSSSARKLAARGINTVLAGLGTSAHRRRELVALGLTFPDPRALWFADLDRALEWIEAQLLSERWPAVAQDAPVELSETPLTAGLTPRELEELRSCLARVDVAAGRLFQCGEPGDSMYVVHHGLVEIRVDRYAEALPRRLAVFGPGSIFGEIAMLTAGERTADAVCVKPTVLYQLTRSALHELETRSPALHARIVSNLNLHLANRLIAATANLQTS